jgi:hypothetical protein
MSKIPGYKRWGMKKAVFACPDTRNYPLTDASHVRNAASRYRQKRTIKCAGGLKRICKAMRRFGIGKSKVCRVR